jgi:ribonuclease III
MARGDPLQPLLHGDPLKVDALNAGDVDLAALTKGVGHDFARPQLAAEALTHRSALDRRPELKTAFPHGNERLEFLGDRVLSLAMADLLLRRFPHEREGELARRHAALVRAETLVDIAESIGLGAHIRLGDSEKARHGGVQPNILADTLEALLGAIFLDAGFAAAATCIGTLWGERLTNQTAAPRDAKTALQEWAQARRLPLPDYKEVGREGPAHAPVFVVDVAIKGHESGRGRGGSKREAERLAAVALLERIAQK